MYITASDDFGTVGLVDTKFLSVSLFRSYPYFIGLKMNNEAPGPTEVSNCRRGSGSTFTPCFCSFHRPRSLLPQLGVGGAFLLRVNCTCASASNGFHLSVASLHPIIRRRNTSKQPSFSSTDQAMCTFIFTINSVTERIKA